MSKLDSLRKKLEKKQISMEMNEPTAWISTGNAALNYRLSGRLDVGIPNKRSVLYWGESGTGKTFLTSNACKEAQALGYKIIYIDSEESISEHYMEKIGINLDDEWFLPISVDTIEECIDALATIFEDMGENDKFILIIDSLAGLLSEKEADEFSKGTAKGDMGQMAKKLKLMVKNVNKKISNYDAFCIMVTHAYMNQDMLNGEGRWICSGGKGMQFFPSFSIKLEKAKLKDGEDKTKVNGVRIKAEVTKTRFTSPNQKCELKVPYDTGLDFTDGLLDILVEDGVVDKNGAWYNFEYKGEVIKFQGSKLPEHYDKIMELYNNRELVEKDAEYDVD